jgi:hypothetical protein
VLSLYRVYTVIRSKLEKSTYDASQQSTDVTLSVDEKVITPETESITLIFNNMSDEEYIYGEDLHLEMEVDGVWYVVKMLENVGWNDIGYILPPKDSSENTFPIKNSYGRLNPGNYRIIKTLYSNGEPIFSIAEFKIQ